MGIVYHYTDPQALKGVVENAELWATDFRYLNDSQELIYTWAAFVQRLEQLAAEPGQYSEAYRAQLEALKRMNAMDLMQFDDAMFVACFTDLADVASQWIGYGASGRGFALGFESERIRTLQVPQYRHGADGQLAPMTATLAGGPDSGKDVEFKWNAFLQKASYGEGARELVVNGLIDSVRRISEDSGTFDDNVGNCISHTHGLVHRLPLVKHPDFQGEQEHRITITEHFGGKSLNQKQALHSLGRQPFTAWAQGALETVDVQFRPHESKVFIPYVRLPFERDALVKVIIGPNVNHRLAEATVRRMLDRNGFRDTVIEASQSPLQV
jgi:truncated hemoglobin YjbI